MKWITVLLAIFISSQLCGQADTLVAGLYKFTANSAKPNKNGESRLILQSPTADLSYFRIHNSVLLPGLTNHPLVAYNDKEEVLLVKEGVLTVQLDDEIRELPAGSVVLMQPGSLQNCSNKTNQPVSYVVLAFVSKDSIQLERANANGGSNIHDWNEMTIKTTDKGFSRPIIRKPTSMFPLFDIHATTLNAGQISHAPHTHRNEEVIVLIEGSGEMFINGKNYAASVGDILYVSPFLPHNFINTGNTPVTYFAIQWTR